MIQLAENMDLCAEYMIKNDEDLVVKERSNKVDLRVPEFDADEAVNALIKAAGLTDPYVINKYRDLYRNFYYAKPAVSEEEVKDSRKEELYRELDKAVRVVVRKLFSGESIEDDECNGIKIMKHNKGTYRIRVCSQYLTSVANSVDPKTGAIRYPGGMEYRLYITIGEEVASVAMEIHRYCMSDRKAFHLVDNSFYNKIIK